MPRTPSTPVNSTSHNVAWPVNITEGTSGPGSMSVNEGPRQLAKDAGLSSSSDTGAGMSAAVIDSCRKRSESAHGGRAMSQIIPITPSSTTLQAGGRSSQMPTCIPSLVTARASSTTASMDMRDAVTLPNTIRMRQP